MPNWCENDVYIEGPAEAMNHFIDTYCERDPEKSDIFCRICFGKIIPIEEMPDEEGQIKGWAQINHQADRWGCKWDSSGYELMIQAWDDRMQISGTMETPWGPPEHVVARIRELFTNDPKLNDPKLAGCSLDEWFYKEPGMELAGWL
jgi:hypothetical protein